MIKLKFNINFDKFKKEFEPKKVNETVNIGLSTGLADILKKFIKTPNNGLAKLSPTQISVRQNIYNTTDTRPLFLTGKLHDSLKGSREGLKGVPYINKGPENHASGYEWKSDHPDRMVTSFDPPVPPRNIMMGYTNQQETKNLEDFKKDFVKLLNKAIRRK
tara:strand:+ start:65 stop:547 length:483 start_codon:yes stop_codon:yes gene_type:complete